MSEMADTGKRPQQLQNCPRAPPPFPPPSCPRCYSGNTKFCYYNNYSVTQPRYLCKNCRRYWTLGGVLRYIPTGGNSRKRNRVDSSSSSSPLSIPPPPSGSSDSHDKFRPPARHTTQSFSGGVFFNQTPLKFSPGSEFRGVNNLFHGLNVAPPTPINYGHRESGSSYFQRPQFQPPPPQPPPTVLTGQNVATSNSTTLMGPNNIVSIDRDHAAAANVVNINEWCELNDMENEGDPFQSYKPPPP